MIAGHSVSPQLSAQSLKALATTGTRAVATMPHGNLANYLLLADDVKMTNWSSGEKESQRVSG